MVETPSVVDIVAVRPEPNYPAPAESLTYALDDVDFKEYETSNVHLLEQKGEEVFLDPLLADSYEDSFAISKLLSHSEAAKMTDVAGEDLSESLDKGASSHQNNVAVSSDYGGRTDNMIWDVQLTTESNILEAHQDGKETLSDSIHHSNSHSAGIFLSPSKLINDEAYLSNSHSYFLYSNLMEDESPLPGHGGCRESKDGIDLAFLDTPILLDEVTSAESWTDNAVCSRYVQDNGSTESLHDGNQVQTKTSERANFGFEERFVSSEEGIKSEIFSLYSRSSSCVSDVNMIETLTGVTFPEPKNDNNFSVVERNPMKDPKIFHADSYTNNTRSAEFIADINVMENLNAGKEAGAGSVHDVSLSFLNTLGASDVSCSIGKTDNRTHCHRHLFRKLIHLKACKLVSGSLSSNMKMTLLFVKLKCFLRRLKDDEDFLSDSNMVKNLEMLQSAQSSSPEILHDSSLCVGSSISVDGGNDFNNSSYNPGSVMHTAEMNTENFLGLKEGVDRDSSSMNYSNYSISSPPMPDENLIQIPGAVKEGSFEPNYEYPSSFEETSTSGSYSYNNPMSSLHASMKVSVRSSRKELPDLVLEDVDRFGEISGDEMSNKSQSENGLSCELTAITEAETLYTKIQDCTEASNIDSTKASNIDSTTEASNVDTTKASESATEGLFETEHHREPELVLNLVGIPFIDEDEGKKTEQDCGSSNADSCHHEIRILETLQELPIAVGTEKGLLEDSNICECNCIDKEPKDLGINDIENDVEDLDVGHKMRFRGLFLPCETGALASAAPPALQIWLDLISHSAPMLAFFLSFLFVFYLLGGGPSLPRHSCIKWPLRPAMAVGILQLQRCLMSTMTAVVVPEPHVLAVDDSIVDRAVISRLLRSSKYRVTTVDSGKRALEVLSLDRNVQMIITDYCMPEMTGYDLLKRVKESAELPEIPVVIMSSENSPARIRQCLEEGAEDFLIKPVRASDVSRLCSRVRNS
ncbi:hypothetical protein PR202_ga03399 [Eleusine coracana subsp. coracana]|uniref:Response regulatory domain-containing protein n=1 Tax=Eleusine coracana subsp. coracana TaxID=191504 RepID=A0AAV5BNX8_ELECO|nr:hypothetical protein PR202_ga03399 [Eleusine coracana subsp. coracana]